MIRRYRSLTAALLISACALVFSPSAEASVLDQDNLYAFEPGMVSSGGGIIVGGPFNVGIGQTFVAGLTGQLDSVDIQIALRDDIPLAFSFSVYNVIGGLPAGDPLGTVLSAFDDTLSDDFTEPTTVSLDFSHLAVSMVAGSAFALALEVVPGSQGTGIWTFNVNGQGDFDTYTDGYAITRGDGEGWTDDVFITGTDFGFATYVTPIPLPAAGWLFIGALGTLFARHSTAVITN